MRICKEDKWKTVFQTQYGYFEYQMMFFDLSNIPISFQSYINKILVKKFNIFMIIYLNNILIYIDNISSDHAIPI